MAALFFGVLLLVSCKPDEGEELKPLLEAEKGEELLGGTTTIFNATTNAFALQAPGVSGMDALTFFSGRSFFHQSWVTAPASTEAIDGLGPVFNARSCVTCHGGDGRGRPPIFPGETNHGLLVRLSLQGKGPLGEPVPDPIYGDQLQDQSLLNLDHEGDLEITYTEISGTYADGTPYTLQQPNLSITNLGFGQPFGEWLTSPRVAQQMIGMGLLEAIDEATILAFADENDMNGDGISGRPNLVWDYSEETIRMGRFGWKANQPDILQQVAAAFSGDIGISSPVFPDQNCSGLPNCDEIISGGEPEITAERLDKVVLYTSLLAVPARRNWTDQRVLNGKEIFNNLGCDKCHIPKITTGVHPRFDVLSNQTIRPYTDMLLHDMGEGLADGRPDFEATGSEWRTQPLWGIGLFETVNNHTRYLHDGRARNLEEAVLWHGGEASQSQEAFKALSEKERKDLILFLESL